MNTLMFFLVLAVMVGPVMAGETKLVIFPAPGGEVASGLYGVKVNGEAVFVHGAKVRQAIWEKPGLWSHKVGCAGEDAAFAAFDFAGTVTVEVTPARAFKTAQVLPTSAGVKAEVAGGVIRMAMDTARHVTVLLDGSDKEPLHLFVSEPERDVPDLKDPNVIAFGPGVHEISTIRLRSNQTLYVAGGAVLMAKLDGKEKGTYSDKWQVTFYEPLIEVKDAEHVRICGRGIVDASLLPHPARTTIQLEKARDVRIDGVIIRDSANWAMCLANSEQVTVTNVKEISGRLNSDGINTVSSQHVRIADCFVRNRDDSIVVKTTNPKREASDVVVENCTIWNDWGYALGATYETRAAISNVTFRNCDVIFSDVAALGVRVCDAATVSGITFENIRVENPKKMLVQLIVTHDVFGTDAEAGHIKDVTFRNITCAKAAGSDISGFDAEHRVEGVVFENVTIGGVRAEEAGKMRLKVRGHAGEVRFVPGR